MDLALLVNLTSKAWALKILALMDAGIPGRQAPLVAETTASRTAFAASLTHLMKLGLLEKNPGHGHPLRPEFRLTASGKIAAAMASRILHTAPDAQAFAILKRSWTLPVLAVTSAPRRFSSIRSEIGAITDRALSLSLVTLEKQHWLRREIDVSERTPFPTYRAVNIGRKINRAIDLECSSNNHTSTHEKM